MVSFSKKDVNNIAHLAKLNINDEQIGTYAKMISEILTEMAKLKEVDTSNIIPVSNITIHETKHKKILKNNIKDKKIT